MVSIILIDRLKHRFKLFILAYFLLQMNLLIVVFFALSVVVQVTGGSYTSLQVTENMVMTFVCIWSGKHFFLGSLVIVYIE